MADENRNHNRQASEPDPLDRELDAALAKYAAVEPRVGLEERVLAHLRAKRERVPDRVWWRWSVFAAVGLVAVVVVTVTLVLRTNPRHAPAIANHPSAIAPSGQKPEQRIATNGVAKEPRSQTLRPAAKHVLRRTQPAVIAQAAPKLDQFPSPQPLSEQERILASYVEKYPEQAVLLARARTEALRQDQLEEMKAFPSSNRATDSEEGNSDSTER